MIPLKTLVTWYSRTGNTRAVGEAIARELGADSEEIIDLKKRTGLPPIRWLAAGRDAMRKRTTDIKFVKSPEAYDLVIVGTPIWAGNIAPAVRTYLGGQRLGGKRLACFYTGGSPSQRIPQDMAALAPGAEAAGSLGVTDKEVKAGAHLDRVRAFCAGLRK